MIFTVWCKQFHVEHNVTKQALHRSLCTFLRNQKSLGQMFLMPSANGVQGTVGGAWKKRMGALEKLQVIWCYFEKQTRGQMLHHVRHVVCWVATQAGRCEGQLDKPETDELGFTTERESDETQPGGAATGV